MPARRRRFGSLVGGLLLGAALPALGAADERAAPLPRLPLAIAIESLTLESGADHAEPANRPNPFASLLSGPAVQIAANDGATPLAVGPAPVASAGAADASVVGDDEFLSADELDVPLPAGAPPRPGAPARDAPAKPGSKWGLAPVRLGGVLSMGLRQRTVDGQEDREQLFEARLRANSYIMQPWIALVSADAALTMVRSQSGGDGSAAANNLAGTSITGSGALSVFPQSRFPFQARLGVSDNRSDGTLIDSNTRSVRLSLRQDYRPETGNWSTSGQYDRSELSGDFGRDTVDVMGAAFNATVGRHTLSGNGSLSRNRSSTAAIDDRIAVARHAFRASDALLIDTNAVYTAQQFDFDADSLAVTGETRSAQLYSFASWTPTDSAWRGTGNMRYLKTESTVNGASADSSNMGGGASLSYQANRNLTVFGTITANANKASDRSATSLAETVGLNYSGDPRLFGPYSYNWYGSGSFSNASGTGGESQRSTNATAGHALQRYWQLNALTQLSGGLSQSVSATRSTGLGSASARSLSHAATLTLQANPSEQLSGFLSASVSDNRVSGDDTSSFQLVNVQLSGRWRINAYSELNSNLTWQLSRQASSRTEGGGFTSDAESQDAGMSGNLGYSHTRVFGVRNLRYTLDFRANTYQTTSSRLAGNPDATRERTTLDLDQRLLYRIGRLDAELQVRMAEIEGRRNSLIFFKVSRGFGGF